MINNNKIPFQVYMTLVGLIVLSASLSIYVNTGSKIVLFVGLYVALVSAIAVFLTRKTFN